MYIVFEGIDGAGKTTQIQMLAEWLEANGFRVETLREPTDSKVGVLIREILQQPDAQTEEVQRILGLLFAADRLFIMDRLEDESKIIISDRSFLSSLVYQDDADWIEVLNRYAKRPDLLILLDLDAKTSVARTSGEDTFEMKVGGTTYEVSTHFDTDGRQSVLEQFMALILQQKV